MSGPNPDPESKVFNTGITSNNPLSVVTIVEDPEEIPAEAFVATSNTPTSAGNQLAIDIVDDKEGFLKRLADALGHSFSGKRGLLGLALIGAALTIIILVAKHGDSSKAKAESPAEVIDQKSAMQARIALQTDLSKTSAALVQLGHDKTEVHTMSNAIFLSRGSDIAAAARNHEAPVIVSSDAKSKSLLVAGAYLPSHYQSLIAINVNGYLDSISHKPTSRDILTNSAVIHGESVEK